MLISAGVNIIVLVLGFGYFWTLEKRRSGVNIAHFVGIFFRETSTESHLFCGRYDIMIEIDFGRKSRIKVTSKLYFSLKGSRERYKERGYTISHSTAQGELYFVRATDRSALERLLSQRGKNRKG